MWGNLFFKLSLAEIVEFGIRDSIWGTFAWFRKHLIIDIGPEADFIKIFVLNSHKDKGGKKDSLTDNTFATASKRPKMSQRPYLRAFCKARKSHF